MRDLAARTRKRLLNSLASLPHEVPMRRIGLAVGLAVVLAISLMLAPPPTFAQQAPRTTKIGVLFR
jgi:hypothetical protein